MVHSFWADASALFWRHANLRSPAASCHLHSKRGCLVEYSQKSARLHRSSSSTSAQLRLISRVSSSYLAGGRG